MPARQKSTPADSSAHPGCEATARRGSANPKGKAIPRSLKGNLWLAADSRNAVKTAEGNRSNTMDEAEPGGANRVERDSLLKAARRAHAGACGQQIAKGSPQGARGGVHQPGVPPKGNANFARVQPFIHHLAPQGMAGVDFVCLRFASAVLANGSMSSNQSGEGEISRVLPSNHPLCLAA